MWTSETEAEYAEYMENADRQRGEESGPGLLVLIDAGELDMDALAALFS